MGCRRQFLPLLFLLACALCSSGAFAQLYPFYDSDESYIHDGRRETWAPWPFYGERHTTNTLTRGFHPFYVTHREFDSGNRDVDMLWPIYSYRYRPERESSQDYESSYLFPLYYSRTETRFNSLNKDRYLLPFYYQGREEKGGNYFILFPFVWYAANARLAVPFFPARPVTFGALFPIAGDIRGYYNRDRIRFFLWPIMVHSSDGVGEDYHETYSLIWPITGLHKGPQVRGFRLWPLVSYVEKDDEFKRAYWLWPLGHYRKGRVSKTDDTQEDVTLFIPFYANFKRPNLSLNMVFPFYGRLEVGQRTTQGYALAIYNRDTNYRRGVQEDRYFWFLIRNKKAIPGVEPDPTATVGGGFFPFYTRTHSATRVNKNIIWPFHVYRHNDYRDYSFTRSYVIPFYSRQVRRMNNGDEAYAMYVFPFMRKTKTLRGKFESNALHLFPYTRAAPMDRTWAPLWTYWEKEHDLESDAVTVRVAKELSKYERRADGSTRRQLNLLLFRYNAERDPEGNIERGHTQFLFGLVGRHRDPELKTEILGFKF